MKKEVTTVETKSKSAPAHVKMSKTPKQLERHFKGVANHWRIHLLLIIAETPGITLEGVAGTTGGNIKTISEHLRRLTHAGLIEKHYSGHTMAHTLSPYGKIFIAFIHKFSNS